MHFGLRKLYAGSRLRRVTARKVANEKEGSDGPKRRWREDRMALKDLAGKRTGRRPGTKSAPSWVRDVRWVYRNIANPDAKPPSELAKRLLTMAREHPDRFVDCLALADPPEPIANR